MILTRKELAEKLRITILTVINWEKRGMPVLRAGLKSDPRYDWEDVKQWMSKKDASNDSAK